MKESKFFEKFLENISRLDESNIKLYLESVEGERRTLKQILDYLDEALIVITNKKIIYLNNEAKRILNAVNIKTPIPIEEAKKTVVNKEIIDFILISLFDADYMTEFSENSVDKRYYQIEKISTVNQFYIIKIKDITENKKIEFRLKNLESISALNSLAAGIAHEIKNPLTAIDLHTQIINRAIEKKLINIPIEVANYVHIIDEEQKRLNKIVNDFLTAARKRELKLTFEDINLFLEEIIHFIEPEIKENAIELKKEFENIPKIFIDKDYLRQAFLNIFKNAIEAMEKNKTHENFTTFSILKIKTFYDRGSDSIGISIIDNGPGIDHDKLQKIFEPYYTTKEYGTGLGLTIVYKIIKEHGGDIKVESEKKKGSSFTIFLPTSQGTRMLRDS